MAAQMRIKLHLGRIVAGLVLCLLLAASSACSSDAVDTGGYWVTGDRDTTDIDDAAAADAAADSDSGLDYDHGELSGEETGRGLWAMKFAITYTTVLPVVEEKVQLVLIGIALLDAEWDHSDFYFTERFCDFRMNLVEDIDFEIIFPEKAIEAIPVEQHHAVMSGFGAGATFTSDPALDIYGGDADAMADPFDGPLPTEPDDPLVVDFEDDGKPGVTTKVNGFVQGDIYVLIRLMRLLEGTFTTDELIEGSIESKAEMNTLGAEPILLDCQLDLARQPAPDMNRFEMVRLEGGATCEELLSLNDSGDLFGYDPMEHAVPLGRRK